MFYLCFTADNKTSCGVIKSNFTKIWIHTKAYTQTLRAVLFIIAKKWNSASTKSRHNVMHTSSEMSLDTVEEGDTDNFHIVDEPWPREVWFQRQWLEEANP